MTTKINVSEVVADHAWRLALHARVVQTVELLTPTGAPPADTRAAWPTGYLHQGHLYCPDCAERSTSEGRYTPVHDEDSGGRCAGCGEVI